MNGMRSSAPDPIAVERAYLKKVIEAGGIEGLSRQAAQARLDSFERLDKVQKAMELPIGVPLHRGMTPRKGEQSERGHLERVIGAGGLDGLTAQMAQERLTKMEIAELIQKAPPIVQPSWPGAGAPRKGDQSDRSPIYFTAEDIKTARGERLQKL
jgi:hypothetical protein